MVEKFDELNWPRSFGLVMVSFFKTYEFITALITLAFIGAAYILSLLLGTIIQIQVDTSLILKYGPFVAMILTIAASVKAVQETINKDRRKAADNFYAISRAARIDRAYHAFGEIIKEGMSARDGVAEHHWNPWEKKVKELIAEHCEANIRDFYFNNTGRIEEKDRGRELSSRPEFDQALKTVRDIFGRDFEVGIK